MSLSKTILYYVHDPMCSWCWGFCNTWSEIQARLPAEIEVRYLLGGLAEDSDQPMPEELQVFLQDTWRKIEGLLDVPFNFDFWTQCKPRRSTYLSCRSVIAADKQGQGREMILAIQRAYYCRAMNPSDSETHCQLADELGLDAVRFATDLAENDTQVELMRQIELGRKLGAIGLPSLIVDINGKAQRIQHDYLDADISLNQIADIRAGINPAM